MKKQDEKQDVISGACYVAKVSGKLATVRIIGESPYGGWLAVNVETRRDVRIRGAQRLRYRVVEASDPAIATVPATELHPGDTLVMRDGSTVRIDATESGTMRDGGAGIVVRYLQPGMAAARGGCRIRATAIVRVLRQEAA